MTTVKLKEVAIVSSGNTAPKKSEFTNNGVPFIRVSNLDDLISKKSEMILPKVSIEIVNKRSMKLCHRNSIIFAKSGMSCLKNRVYKLNSNCYIVNHLASISCNENYIDPDFLKYYLKWLKPSRLVVDESYPSIRLSDIKELKIPLPPLPTQKKIVEVLDKAQSLIDARKEQIRLLDELTQSIFYDMFGDPVTNLKGWELSSVQKVCNKIVGGGTPSKAKAEYYIGNIPWVTPKDMKVIEIIDSKDHINEKAIQNSSTNLVKAGSLLMVIRSGILKRHLPVAINIKNVTINQDMKAFTVKESILDINYFLYYWIMSERYVLTKVRAFTADNIEFNQIKNMHIPLPPIELQNEFAQKVKIIKYQKEHMQQSLKQLENSFNSLIKKAYNGELF